MPTPDLIVSVDQGSSSTKALLVAADNALVAHATVPVGCAYPRPGWVEQSATELASSLRQAVAEVMSGVDPARVAGLTLSTQRESLVLWDEDGQPAAPVITWQDQRTAPQCAELLAAGHARQVRETTGLPLDPMFSGTKATWLLDEADPDRTRSRNGRLRLGTVDSWLLATLTGEHLTEIGNASRTQLLDLGLGTWDATMLDIFGVPRRALPQVVGSGGPYPSLRGVPGLLDGTPVLAVLADSHAALFAHGAWAPGDVKATYGTGSSVMGICAAADPVPDGLCHTIAWQLPGAEQPVHALEGNIRSSGSTLAWLARTVSRAPAEIAALAASTGSSGGVTIIPAFNGLGAPWWDAGAQGLISGLSLGSGLGHLARAALESIAFQIEDVVRVMGQAVGDVPAVLADGGASANDHLMQLQADLGGRPVRRSQVPELSALGAAHVGGLVSGFWDQSTLKVLQRPQDAFVAQMEPSTRAAELRRWADAVARARLTACGEATQ